MGAFIYGVQKWSGQGQGHDTVHFSYHILVMQGREGEIIFWMSYMAAQKGLWLRKKALPRRRERGLSVPLENQRRDQPLHSQTALSCVHFAQ